MGAATATLRVRAVRVIYPDRLLFISLFGSMATLRVQMSLRAMRCFYWPNSLFFGLFDPQTKAGPHSGQLFTFSFFFVFPNISHSPMCFCEFLPLATRATFLVVASPGGASDADAPASGAESEIEDEMQDEMQVEDAGGVFEESAAPQVEHEAVNAPQVLKPPPCPRS